MSYVVPGAGAVWVANASATSSVFSNSSIRYTPLVDAANNYVEFQFIAPKSGRQDVSVVYAMSAAQSNAVNLRVDYVALSASGDPTSALTSGTATNVTVTNDVLIHTLTSSTVGDLAIAATEGDVVMCRVNRIGGAAGDTHTGDLRIIDARVK